MARKKNAADKTAGATLEPRVRWTKATLAKVLPGPGNPPAPHEPEPPLEALRRMARLAEPAKDRWVAGLDANDGGVRERIQEVLGSYEDPEGFLRRPLDPQLEAVRAAMLDLEYKGVWDPRATGTSGSTTERPQLLVGPALDLWQQGSGLALAVEVVVRSSEIYCFSKRDYGATDRSPLWLGPRPAREFWGGGLGGPWRELRARLASAPPEACAVAEATAERLRGADEHARVPLAFAFPGRQDWCREDTRLVLSDTARVARIRANQLLVTLRDPAIAPSLAPFAYYPDAEVIYTILHNLGVDAVPTLAAIIRRQGGIEKKTSLKALSLIESPEAIRFFVQNLGDRDVQLVAASYLQRLAQWARPELETMARGGDEAARTLLAGLSASGPARALPDSEASAEPAAAEGSSARFPWFLVRPPWAGGRPPTREALDLQPLPLELRLDWVEFPPGCPTDFISESHMRFRDEGTKEWVYESLADGDEDAYEPNVLELFPDDEALDIWRRAPVKFWKLHRPECVDGLVDRFGAEVLPGLLACVQASPAAVLPALLGVVSREMAETVAAVLVRRKTARPAASNWLARHPEEAATALIPAAQGPAGRRSDEALAALRLLVTNGFGPRVEAVAARYGEGVPEALQGVLEQDPVLRKTRRPPKLPPFWAPDSWTRPLVLPDLEPLPREATENLGRLLALVPPGSPSPALQRVRETCDRPSLTAFALDLFEAWRSVGHPSREVWAFHALGHLGDDGVVTRLAPLIREWPLQGLPSYAATALDVLAVLGTDAALAEINKVAGKFKSQGLKKRAAVKVHEIAAARGLTADQLADRVVPTLDLDPDASRILDFGPRQFRVGFDEQLRPYVETAEGKRLRALPEPGQKDDASKAADAAKVWKVVKKEVRLLSTRERNRLETALCARRRWAEQEFRRWLVGHPLLVHLVRSLLWATYSASGHLETCFRVAEDRSFADEQDRSLSVESDAVVGLPHPLELSDDARADWWRIFEEYRILQPFPQIERPFVRRTTADESVTELTTVAGAEVDSTRALGLEARGWQRTDDGGGVSGALFKPLPGTAWQAVLPLDPGLFADPHALPTQKPGVAIVVPRRFSGVGEARLIPMGRLDEIIYSELVSDLLWLKG